MELDRLRNECAAALDLERVPLVYVELDPQPRARTVGLDEPFIVVTTGLVQLLDGEGMRFAIGHEMGHVLSGHAVYTTMMILLRWRLGMAWNPLSGVGLRVVLAALREWSRKAELSCDRAGLLCSQDATAALRAHIQLAGGIDPDKVNVPAFLRQAEEYEGVEDIRDSWLKLRGLEFATHPLAVVRAAQLQKWAASAEYRAILSGDYPRRRAAALRSSRHALVGCSPSRRGHRDLRRRGQGPHQVRPRQFRRRSTRADGNGGISSTKCPRALMRQLAPIHGSTVVAVAHGLRVARQAVPGAVLAVDLGVCAARDLVTARANGVGGGLAVRDAVDERHFWGRVVSHVCLMPVSRVLRHMLRVVEKSSDCAAVS